MPSSRRTSPSSLLASGRGLSTLLFASGLGGALLAPLLLLASRLFVSNPSVKSLPLEWRWATVVAVLLFASVLAGLLSVGLVTGTRQYGRRVWIMMPLSLLLLGVLVARVGPVVVWAGLFAAVVGPLVLGVAAFSRRIANTPLVMMGLVGSVLVWASMVLALVASVADGDIMSAVIVPVAIVLEAMVTAALLASTTAADGGEPASCCIS